MLARRCISCHLEENRSDMDSQDRQDKPTYLPNTGIRKDTQFAKVVGENTRRFVLVIFCGKQKVLG